MENKTNIQSAQVAHPASTGEYFELTSSEVWGLHHYGKQLKDVMTTCDGLGYLHSLQALDFDYKNLLLAIDTGGWAERRKDEDPAEILEMLRGYSITPQQNANRAFLLQNMGELLQDVEGLLFALNGAINRAKEATVKGSQD